VALMAVPKFERFFRAAAGLDVDKSDVKRYSDFVNQKLFRLLLGGQAVAELQESIHGFRGIDQAMELQPVLDALAARPCLWRGDYGAASRGCRRLERGPFPRLKLIDPQPNASMVSNGSALLALPASSYAKLMAGSAMCRRRSRRVRCGSSSDEHFGIAAGGSCAPR
jgi:hypothetical protein